MRAAVAVLVAGLLVTVAVAVVSAKSAAAYSHVTGSYVAGGDSPEGWKAMHLFEIRADSVGNVQFGYYTSEVMTGPAEYAPARTQATVETIRFFKTDAGAPAAEFTGQECLLSGPDPAQVGNCNWYHIVVTDGTPVGRPDTFCGATVANSCYVWTVQGDGIRID